MCVAFLLAGTRRRVFVQATPASGAGEADEPEPLLLRLVVRQDRLVCGPCLSPWGKVNIVSRSWAPAAASPSAARRVPRVLLAARSEEMPGGDSGGNRLKVLCYNVWNLASGLQWADEEPTRWRR